MTLYKWSQVASADATADSTINWAEGQSPSSVNDSARAMMAATAKYRDDIAGAIVTSGTANAYTLSSYQGFDTFAHMNGQMIAFTPHVTNAGGGCSINVDGLGAIQIFSAPSVPLLAGTIIAGTPYTATFNSSANSWFLQNFYGNPYNVPLGGGMIYVGNTAPNSSFAFPFGQALSRTTYAALYALTGNAFGAGDGSATFNIADLRGRVPAGVDNMGGTAANVLSGYTINSQGGTATQTLVTGNLPAYTPSGSVALTFPSQSFTLGTFNATGGGSTVYSVGGSPSNVSFSITGASASFTGTAQGGTSAPFSTIQPTIALNYILRII